MKPSKNNRQRPLLVGIARRDRAVEEAIRLFESHPDFARAQVRMRERMEEAARDAPADAGAYGTQARLEYVLLRLDIRAEALLELVSDIHTQNAFMTILEYLERSALQEYTGFPPEGLKPVSAEAHSHGETIHAKVQRWTEEGYKRLAFPKAPPEPKAEAAANADEGALSMAQAGNTISAPPRQKRQNRYPRSSLQPLKWQDIEMRFCSHERVWIHVGEEFETYNFADLGLDDRRTRNANRTWEALLRLAESEGTIRAGEGRETRPKMEKRMQAIRNFMRYFFNLSGEPLEFVRTHEYHARFRIRCERAYHT